MPMNCIIHENIPLDRYTTYRIGGPARYFAEPESIDDIAELLNWCSQKELPYFVLGHGSNIVVSDSGFDGLIISFNRKFGKIDIKDNVVTALAGASLGRVVKTGTDQGYAGMEYLMGIPGTIGGGVYINAGAFGMEIKDTVSSVTSITPNGEVIERTHSECAFGYRTSIFCSNNEIILMASFSLNDGDAEALKLTMDETLDKRLDKQPLHLPNAGSMFKRPQGDYAGRLIEAAGLKGYTLGNAQISDKHANFVVHNGQGSGQDIYDLSESVIAKVAANSGVTLEKEQIFIGDFLPWPR